MVIACAALLVALAGTSVAAVSIVIPRNSVGALQLRANSVNSAKVRNGSLLRADFRAGQVPAGPQGRAGPAGPAGPAGATGATGASGLAAPGYTAETLAQSSASDTATTSTSFTNLNGGSLNVTVPTNETDKLTAWFSGASACYGGTALQKCLLKITVDGTELSPAAGSNAVFDNNDLGVKGTGPTVFQPKSSGDLEAHEIVRTSGNLSAGSHTVQVQFSTTSATTAFDLANWALVVQRIKVS
jgi:hypothetical protein